MRLPIHRIKCLQNEHTFNVVFLAVGYFAVSLRHWTSFCFWGCRAWWRWKRFSIILWLFPYKWCLIHNNLIFSYNFLKKSDIISDIFTNWRNLVIFFFNPLFFLRVKKNTQDTFPFFFKCTEKNCLSFFSKFFFAHKKGGKYNSERRKILTNTKTKNFLWRSAYILLSLSIQPLLHREDEKIYWSNIFSYSFLTHSHFLLTLLSVLYSAGIFFENDGKKVSWKKGV